MRKVLMLLVFLFSSFLFSAEKSADFFFKNGEKMFVERIASKDIRINGNRLAAYMFEGSSYPSYLSGQIFISPKGDINDPEIRKMLDLKGVHIIEKIKRTDNTYLAMADNDTIATSRELVLSSLVNWAEPDFYYQVELKSSYRPDDPLFANQWHLENTGQTGMTGEDARVAQAWQFIREKGLEPGKNVRIGIIDDGFDLNHEDMQRKFLKGIDLYDNDDVPYFGPGDQHGTCVAGVAAANYDNGIGVAGACPFCSIVPVRVSANLINGVTEVNAFNYLLDRGVEVMSNSWGPKDRGGPADMSEPLKEIIKKAASEGRNGRGVVILFAAGNGNESISDKKSFDGFAANPYVIAVGATNASGYRALYSDYGEDLDIMAPSCDIDPDEFWDPFNVNKFRDGIWTIDNTGLAGYRPGNYESEFGGTSSATPLAAGIIALMIGVNPDLTREQIYDIITKTADKVSPDDAKYDKTGFSKYYAYGRINALEAVKEACRLGCGGIKNAPEEDYYGTVDEDNIDFGENRSKNVDRNETLVHKFYEPGCALTVF